MEELEPLLNRFNGISLIDTCSKAALLERVDLKYVLKQEDLPRLLSACTNHYAVLDINGSRISRYETDYYDTKELHFYRVHHAGHMNRHKIRVRRYPDTATGFLELKRKTNKGITFKTRKKLDFFSTTQLSLTEEPLFNELSTQSNEPLMVSAEIKYQRITLVSLHSAERVTIDLFLEFKHEHKTVALPGFVVAEVKQEKSSSSFFTQLMKQEGLRAGAMSKYCMAICFLYAQAKKNRFKPYLNKIQFKNI